MRQIIKLMVLLQVFLSVTTMAKVAYIPLLQQETQMPIIKDKIMVLDLETGDILKILHFPDIYIKNNIILNDDGTHLYFFSNTQLFSINTHTLEIENTIQLPDPDFFNPRKKYFLNQNNDKIHFIDRALDHSVLFQIDLINNEVTSEVVFDYNENVLTSMANKNANTIIVSTETFDPVQNSYIMETKTYDLETFSLINTIPDLSIFHYSISLDGLNYYHINRFNGILYSRKLSDFSLNWQVEINDFDGNTYQTIFENDAGVLTLIGQTNTYKINKNTGEFELYSSYGNDDNQGSTLIAPQIRDEIDENHYLAFNDPFVICPDPPPVGSPCIIYPGMDINIVNIKTNSIVNVFHSDTYAGSFARRNIIGEKFYSIPVIPTLNKSLLIYLGLIILLIGAFFLMKKTGIINR